MLQQATQHVQQTREEIVRVQEAADKVEEEEEDEEEERKQHVRENSLEEEDVMDEEDNTVKCLVCDKAFPDVYM